MSTLKVETFKIDQIFAHPNADKLEIAAILGWTCIVSKGQYERNDIAVYFPIDSILPQEIESKIFGPDAKIKLSKHRVRTIKIRGVHSMGLLVSLETLGLDKNLAEGVDLTEKLGVTKFEPEAPDFQQFKGRIATRKEVNPYFHKYTDIDNIKKFRDIFAPDEEVIATEKIHGTNFRAGYVPFVAFSLWDKIKVFFGRAPKSQFVYGSRNVQLQNKGLFDKAQDNVYARIVKQYNLRELLNEGEVVYGEIYGEGIQKNYSYGCVGDERKFVIFDIEKDSKFLNYDELTKRASEIGPSVPLLYRGPFSGLDIDKIVDGDSVLAPSQKIREGAVLRGATEQMFYGGRKIAKAINPEYLMKDNTEFH